MFENPDTTKLPEGLKPPKYPEGYETMNQQEKSQADELLRRQNLFYLYRVFNGGLNKLHLKALQESLIMPRQLLVNFAGQQWTGDIMNLRGALMRMREFWAHFPNKGDQTECPIEFTEQEISEQSEHEDMWYKLNTLVSLWREELGLSEEGWVSAEMYEHAVERNESLKAEFSEGGSVDELAQIKRGWPFQDHEEFF